MKRLKELVEQRGTLNTELKTLQDTLEKESRAMTEGEKTRFTEITGELDKVNDEIKTLEDLDKRNKAAVNPVIFGGGDGDDKEIQKNFRMIDVLQAGRGERASGFLKEIHEEGVKEMNARGLAYGEGVILPAKALRNVKAQQRANQVAGTGNVGGYLVETVNEGGVIEFLGEKLVLGSMGVMTLDNLVGNVNMPAGTTGLTTAWETEVSTADETNETFAQISYTPNRLAGWTNISKQLIAQGNPSISAYLTNEIQKAFARAWQKAAIHGNGAGIDGIVGTSGIGSVAGGTHGAAPTWANIVNLYRELAVDNADEGSLYYLTNAKVTAKLQQTSKQSSGVEGNFILGESKDMLNGLGLKVTNAVKSDLTKGTATDCSAIICGNFADLGLASWGGLEILFDPYSQAKAGMTVMVVNGYVDANVHRAVSFSAMLDALTT